MDVFGDSLQLNHAFIRPPLTSGTSSNVSAIDYLLDAVIFHKNNMCSYP